MNLFQAGFLGLIQGLAEFLPISSSGHLEVAQHLLGVSGASDQMLLLSVLLHVGTLLSVVVVFWKDWMAVLRHPIKSRWLGLLIVASVPALVAAVLLGDRIDALFGSGFIGIAFLVTGVFLLIAERLSRRGRHMSARDTVTVKDAAVMGCMQAVALIPGVSRSGSTLLGGIASGLNRQKAAKFSFMMSAPAILGSLLVEGKDALESGLLAQMGDNLLPLLFGIAVSAVAGFLAIRYMLKLITRVSLNWFALYVFILGAVVIALQIIGVGGFPALSFLF